MSIERGFFSGIVKTTTELTMLALLSTSVAHAPSVEAATKKKVTTTTTKKESVKRKVKTTTTVRPITTITPTTVFRAEAPPSTAVTTTTTIASPDASAQTSTTLPTKMKLDGSDLVDKCWVQLKPYGLNDPSDPRSMFYEIGFVKSFPDKSMYFSSVVGSCGIIANSITDYANPTPPGTLLKGCDPNEVLGLGTDGASLSYTVLSKGALVFPLAKQQEALNMLKKDNPNAHLADNGMVIKTRDGFFPRFNTFSLGGDLIRQGTIPVDGIAAAVCAQRATQTAQQT